MILDMSDADIRRYNLFWELGSKEAVIRYCRKIDNVKYQSLADVLEEELARGYRGIKRDPHDENCVCDTCWERAKKEMRESGDWVEFSEIGA